MIRRMKADTLKDLPSKERLQIFVDADPHVAAELQNAKVRTYVMRATRMWVKFVLHNAILLKAILYVVNGKARESVD